MAVYVTSNREVLTVNSCLWVAKCMHTVMRSHGNKHADQSVVHQFKRNSFAQLINQSLCQLWLTSHLLHIMNLT